MKSEFVELVLLAVRREVLKKLVFSRPRESEVQKISGRLTSVKGRVVLSLELSLPGNTVSHKNLPADRIAEELHSLLDEYRQANLITNLTDAEWRITSSGKEALLGADRLRRRLLDEQPGFVSAVEELDRRKNHLLRGDEDFLRALGVSDAKGRVHDKKQGKFRQINRFLEHIEDVYPYLGEGDILIYDLCCGKSYLSFAVYYYLTALKGRRVRMLGIDLKRDVIAWCDSLARELGYSGMRFVCDDVKSTPEGERPNMVISLHACDVATDVVINRATQLKADVILSTPCCHRYLNDKIQCEELSFVTKFPQLRNKLCEAITDALRLARLSAAGYEVCALELTDPDDTPKNTLLRGIRKDVSSEELCRREHSYNEVLKRILGEGADGYLSEI